MGRKGTSEVRVGHRHGAQGTSEGRVAPGMGRKAPPKEGWHRAWGARHLRGVTPWLSHVSEDELHTRPSDPTRCRVCSSPTSFTCSHLRVQRLLGAIRCSAWSRVHTLAA
ncbi:hypothetical protein NDU88_000353 [Pleurodeles waltl]|uniref:Uncharacterized protein n=1 Tax=Pleurodeles waltl TaxID=8319 RepID=A0AAV7P4Q6_PLEWA|nr:hypothetical protein NDU88_000353 [Pleurodeles waltl]